MESVDGWPMANAVRKTLGGKPWPVAASGRDWPMVSSSLGVYVAVHGGLHAPDWLCGGPSLGELSGGNWMASLGSSPLLGLLAYGVGHPLGVPSF